MEPSVGGVSWQSGWVSFGYASFFLFQMSHCTFYAVQLEENKVQVIKDLTENCSSNMETTVSNRDGIESHSSRNKQEISSEWVPEPPDTHQSAAASSSSHRATEGQEGIPCARSGFAKPEKYSFFADFNSDHGLTDVKFRASLMKACLTFSEQ